MSGGSLFSPRMLLGWVAAAVVTSVLSLFLMNRGDGTRAADTVGPNSYSTSAIGQAGFAEMLRTLGIDVVKSQYASREKLGHGGLIVVAEPTANSDAFDATARLLERGTVLLVLPKRQGWNGGERPGWIAAAELLPDFLPKTVLDLAAPGGAIVRRAPPAAWSRNELGIAPSVAEPIQLVHGSKLRPLVADGDDILLGELAAPLRRVWVLSDPDVIENHGILQGENARFALEIVDRLRREGGRVVFDETVHGFVAHPANPLRLLFEFPYLIATLQAALALALLLWATMRRFGAPETAPPALAPGKLGLIRNAAQLLAFGGHQPRMVRRYVQATIRDAARRLHAPRGLSEAGLRDWLRRVGTARSVELDCAEIERRAEAGEGRRDLRPLVAVVRDIHRWKGEILDGAAGNTRDHRRRQGAGAQGGGGAG